MKDIYGKLLDADLKIVKALKGFTIEDVKQSYEVSRFSEFSNKYYDSKVSGGLTLILTNGKIKKKVILGYTELGEWLESEEIL